MATRVKPTCAICGGLGWVDSYGHVRHDAPGAYDHLFKRREKGQEPEPPSSDPYPQMWEETGIDYGVQDHERKDCPYVHGCPQCVPLPQKGKP